MRSISVVIPNYNGRRLLEENLPSVIAALKFSAVDYELIISDDFSTDDSLAYLKRSYPEIIVIPSEMNRGFSITANRGIAMAEKELTFILNNDVKLKADYFTHQFRYFERNDTFGVMGSICSSGGKLIDAAKYPKWSGTTVKSTVNYILPNAGQLKQIPTYFLSGANALVDTKKLKTLKGFNEMYSPFYMEDVDLSVRAWRMGWKCYYEPGSLCHHSVSETIGKYNPSKKVQIISKRNRFTFNLLHLEGKRKIAWIIMLHLNLLYRWIFDARYYASFREFTGRKQNISSSKKEFEALHPVKKLSAVVKEIQEAVRPLEKKLF